jgi:hypothetical protein
MNTALQSLLFGAAVAFAAWLASSYLGDRHDREYRSERIGARNHSGVEPYDAFNLRPGSRNRDVAQGRRI